MLLAFANRINMGRSDAYENNAPKDTPNPSPSHVGASPAAPSSSSSSTSIKPLNPTSQSSGGASASGKFSMLIGWEPSGHVADLAKQSGVSVTPPVLAEFIAHWLTEPLTARTQAEWDKALLQSAKHGKIKAESASQARSRQPAPDNFAEKNYGTGGAL